MHRPRSLSTLTLRVAASVLSILALAAACAPTSTGESPEDVAEIVSRVQTTYVETHFDIAQDQSLASKATASVEVPLRNADGTQQVLTVGSLSYLVRGTCGITFVAPHYAFTAAHCVSSINVPNPAASLSVRTYDVSGVNKSALYNTAVLTGTFPNYMQLAGPPADQLPGFQYQNHACQVAARCDYGAVNCGFTGDIAMLYCPDRAPDAAWLPVAASDPLTGPVEMYWFHELFSMPVQLPGAGAPASDLDEYNHYTLLTVGAEKNNFHYLGSPATALIPMKSIPWPNGTPRKRVGSNWTDLFSCHGTSGSGVLQRNASGNLEFLGPVQDGGSYAGMRLCTDTASFVPGQFNTSYTSNAISNQLQAAFQTTLALDRQPCQPGQVRACDTTCGTQTCGANFNWGVCTSQGGVCSPGATRGASCGNCGSRTDTCSSSCQWTAGTCTNEGVCAPGATQTCCGCSKGCSCSGQKTCTSACTWGSCSGATCKPLSCQ